MELVNPTTEARSFIEEFPLDQIGPAVKELRSRSARWRSYTAAERISKLSSLPDRLRANRAALAAAIATEMGKPIPQAEIEVDRTVDEASYLFEHGAAWLERETAPEGYVEFNPLGCAAIISPWNFPLLLPFRGLLPALVAGNAIVFKPSELTPLIGGQLFRLLIECSPEVEEVSLLVIGGKDHGRAVVASDVDIIAFTGSTVAGKHIASVAAERLKRVILELGGLDAAIVLSDADVVKTAKGILGSNISNSGQVCSIVKRVFVEAPIYDALVQEIVRLTKEISIGDPHESPEMGPLVSENQLQRIESFVEDARRKGATFHSGGKRLDRKGYFYPPTVVTEVTDEMRIMAEEPFGPILPIVPVPSWKEGLERANATRYGLSASVWSANEEHAKSIASQLEVGVVGINGHKSGGVGCPWGGAKESGIGRMKVREGLREFTNTKFVRTVKAS